MTPAALLLIITALLHGQAIGTVLGALTIEQDIQLAELGAEGIKAAPEVVKAIKTLRAAAAKRGHVASDERWIRSVPAGTLAWGGSR